MTPGVAILSAAITVFALVLSIFGASRLNQRNTERLVEELGKRFDARFDAVLAEIKRLDQRIDLVEQHLNQRMDSIEQRVDHLESSIDQRLARIERQLEAIFKPSLPK